MKTSVVNIDTNMHQKAGKNVRTGLLINEELLMKENNNLDHDYVMLNSCFIYKFWYGQGV